MHRVIKPMFYSHDGVSVRLLAPGDLVAIREDLAPGLAADGFIQPASPERQAKVIPAAPETAAVVDTASVEVPAGWQSLHWKHRMALATKIAGAAPADVAMAGEIIAAEVARRGGA